jgi:hypothetical protein
MLPGELMVQRIRRGNLDLWPFSSAYIGVFLHSGRRLLAKPSTSLLCKYTDEDENCFLVWIQHLNNTFIANGDDTTNDSSPDLFLLNDPFKVLYSSSSSMGPFLFLLLLPHMCFDQNSSCHGGRRYTRLKS